MGNRREIFKGAVIGIVLTLAVLSAANIAVTLFQRVSTKKLDFTSKVNEIVKTLESYYVDGVDTSELEESMYAGLVAGVGDRYTTYMTKDEYQSFIEDTEGTYAGIGVVVSPSEDDDNRITVVMPFEGYPGEKAGILPGDKIVKVNGTDVYGNELDKAVSMMKGPAGTSVTVSLYRPSDGNTFDVTITRANINVPTVSHEMLDNNIGYIEITQFERVTYEQFVKAYNDLNSKGMQGLILDLRFNPGGLLDVACNISDVFCPEGTIVYTEDRAGQRQYRKSDKAAFGKPLVVLLNGYSASASEVLSGAVKDNHVAKLVGTTTFGKGLVQSPFVLSDGSAVKVTIQKYFTPNGTSIHGIGIEPDYIVNLPEELQNTVSIPREQDIQLDKAIEVVSEMMR